MVPTSFTALLPAPVLGFLAVHAALRRDCANLVAASGVDGVTAFADPLEDHLALEEQHVLPIWVESLSPADHERFVRFADQHGLRRQFERTWDRPGFTGVKSASSDRQGRCGWVVSTPRVDRPVIHTDPRR